MNKKFFALAALMLLMPMMLGAQALKGSYFLDNSLTRNKINPAFAPYRAYWQLPAIGNFNVSLASNLEVSDFLYPAGDQLYTFLNKNVSVKQFDKALAGKPHIDIATDVNLINFGFFTGKSFWSFDAGVKINADFDIPRDLFMFMKKGSGTEGVYNIGAIKGNAAASAYASLGWSRDFYEYVPGLRVGARARAIVPVAYVGLNLNNVSLTAAPEKWELNTEGALHAAMSGLSLVGPDGAVSPSVDPASLGPAGFGFSFDLGAEYKLEFDGFINSVNFSAAVTDLGMVRYKAPAVQAFSTKGSMTWEGMDIVLDESGSMGGNTTEDLKQQLENLLKIDKEEQAAALTRSTLPSFYVGAEMPFLNNKMSIGALYSARKSWNYTRNELTLSYNLTPAKWFSFGVNYSFLNVTKTLGWILELTPKAGPSLYLGSDYTFVEFIRPPENLGLPFLPMSMRFNVHLGLAFTLGGGKKANN